ncbi:MAG: hypothetical protein ACI8UO_001815 [Verrucomicrobiales bacterium]|jgi:hypothetical protein
MVRSVTPPARRQMSLAAIVSGLVGCYLPVSAFSDRLASPTSYPLKPARISLAALALLLPLSVSSSFAETDLPTEPIELGLEPQFFVDDYMVDNRWPLDKVAQVMGRVFHQPVKHPSNPVIPGQGGYLNVVYDEDAKLFRMIYQDFWYINEEKTRYTYAACYAESKDGIQWDTPNLGLFERNQKGSKDNNVCWVSPVAGPHGHTAQSPFLLELPEEHRRGHKFVMYYVNAKHESHLIGSDDCIHWDPASDTCIAKHFAPDTQSTISWDPKAKLFVWIGRATDRYRDGLPLTMGATRRVCRLTNPELWTEWPVLTQNILIPGEADALETSERAFEGSNFFYGMPTRYHAGIYWGFLEPYALRSSTIETSLAISRNGRVFEQLHGRPRLIERGPKDSWDSGMVFGSCSWQEVGDEWRIYYAGHDGPHNSTSRTPGIGLATIRKEGFVSLRGPQSGGVVCTRAIRWPGEQLLVNCDATTRDHLDHFGRPLEPNQGELKVRIVDAARKPLPGFGYEDSVPFTGDSTRHEVKWKEHSIAELKGQVIRIEFQLKMADLYTFRAATD